jgi:hypothetical protein
MRGPKTQQTILNQKILSKSIFPLFQRGSYTGIVFCTLLFALSTTWISCGSSNQGPAPAPPTSLENDPTELLSLKSIATVPVQNISTQTPSFVTKRTDHITQYPCASCHTKPVAKPQREGISQRWSHLNIQLTHGQTTGLDCQSCHNYNNFEQLQLQNGKTTTFDHSYELCRQCHFQQANDWAGGAHGKRLAGWRGKRVINNCTDCHNPHAPAFDQRIPLKSPTIPRTGGSH